jgi:hypothetical protein
MTTSIVHEKKVMIDFDRLMGLLGFENYEEIKGAANEQNPGD